MPRCGAKTRSGGVCGHFSMPNGRCRYHGGKSTGAKNPRVKHGNYTKETIAFRRLVAQIVGDSAELLVDIDGLS
ncbi:HGGxSTG domain-containing protein [Solemya elarraichensis gill symbiont]|uniref:HGGxSTG domain-containing protein n=1 Tax=Solemya elarraichensis gill symbiont TaxID=1918949 RepID=UPI002481D745|nr:HGGxSTG domain-containing protein [Solemya elarraichensis gill symbiont]